MSLRQPITFTCWCLAETDFTCQVAVYPVYLCVPVVEDGKDPLGISWLSRKSAMLFSMLAYKVCAQAFLSAVLAAGIVDSMWKDMPSR